MDISLIQQELICNDYFDVNGNMHNEIIDKILNIIHNPIIIDIDKVKLVILYHQF